MSLGVEIGEVLQELVLGDGLQRSELGEGLQRFQVTGEK